VFEKRAVRIFAPKGEEVTGNGGSSIPNLYSSPNMIKFFKSRRMR
jgi:hypothetical protein